MQVCVYMWKHSKAIPFILIDVLLLSSVVVNPDFLKCAIIIDIEGSCFYLACILWDYIYN